MYIPGTTEIYRDRPVFQVMIQAAIVAVVAALCFALLSGEADALRYFQNQKALTKVYTKTIKLCQKLSRLPFFNSTLCHVRAAKRPLSNTFVMWVAALYVNLSYSHVLHI